MPENARPYDKSCSRWHSFARELRAGSNPFLDKIAPQFRVVFVSTLDHLTVVWKTHTVQEAVDQVDAYFRETHWGDPWNDHVGKIDPLITLQLKGRGASDRVERQ